MRDQTTQAASRQVEWLEYILEGADDTEKPQIRRQLQAYRRHQEKCADPRLSGIDPFGVVYRCETCNERVYGARYLVSGMSVISSGRTELGRLKQGVEVLDTFTGTWYVTDENGSIPHDNRCMHCGQDMSGVDPETAAQTFDPKSDAG